MNKIQDLTKRVQRLEAALRLQPEGTVEYQPSALELYTTYATSFAAYAPIRPVPWQDLPETVKAVWVDVAKQAAAKTKELQSEIETCMKLLSEAGVESESSLLAAIEWFIADTNAQQERLELLDSLIDLIDEIKCVAKRVKARYPNASATAIFQVVKDEPAVASALQAAYKHMVTK